MRAGLSTIQQTLTPEASAVLNRAIAEAGRRRHGQTTPLHVAAALLSSPSSHLRQACARSHPNPSSSHPLQCRALELCFSVALDRLPSSAAPASDDPPPPISNALMAALKRAQAHQRRGCPESQQQPLLAVKVELDHLLLSILDDPSVSRVMREASFSSPAVKAALLPSSPNPPPRSFYRPAAAFGDVAKVLDVLTRAKRRNPVLVGDADPGAVAGEVVARITRGDAPVGIRPVAVVSAEAEFSCGDRAEIPTKIKELAAVVEARISGGGGAVLDLGDLKWLVEGRSPAADVGRSAVAEMGRLLGQFGGRLWLIGAATCATYLRCQVYFPSMEADWDLQAVPVAPRAVGTGSNAILGSKIESFRGFPATPESISSSSYKRSLCGDCKVGFDREVALLVREDESEKSSEAAPPGARNSLPRWLQIATAPPPTDAQKQEQELMKKWRDCCFRLHRSSSVPVTLKAPPITGFSINQAQIRLNLQPPVKTELNLGIVQKPSAGPKFIGDAASIKRLINGLLDKVSWQPEAASAVAAAVIQSNSAVGKRRNSSPKSDTWLLFAGSDRVAKRKMAVALSDLVFGAPPLVIRPNSPGIVAFNDADELSASFRGQTSIDRVAEALRVNPFAAVFFEDYDQTDCALRETVKRAAERGRLVDSRGREVGLESSIFILGSGWLPEDLRNSDEDFRRSEARITELATSGRHLELQLEDDGTNKRGREWLLKDERFVKRRRDSLSIDLNLADDEAGEGSWNSSDLTVEHEQDQGHGRLAIQSSVVASPCTPEVVGLMDATVVFKPMDFAPLRTRISDSVSAKFTHIMGKERSIAIDDDAVDQIAGGVWLGGETRDLFDEWFDRVLGPAFEQLRDDPKFGDGAIVRLTSANSGQQFHGKRSYLPPSVKLAVGGR